MPRILLVSYHFPPSRAVGALRPGRWARLLPALGFDVEVVCGRLSADGDEVDPSREELVPEGTKVHPVAAPRTGSTVEPGEGSIGERAWRAARDNLGWLALTRDWSWGWGERAAHRTRELLEDGAFDLVVTDGPPFPGMVPVLRVAARGGVPAVLDLRDLWMAAASPVSPWGRLHPRHRRGAWNARLRTEAIRMADQVVLTTPDLVDFMRSHFPTAGAERFVSVPNAYAGADDGTPPPSLPSGGRLRLVHTGSLAYGRSDQAEALIRGLGRLRSRRLAEVELVFVGGSDRRLPRAAAECGVDDLVVFRGWEESDTAERLQREAHALLLFQPPGRLDTRLAIPAKLFDYMARRRNVLAMAGDGPAARMVAEHELGVTLRSDSPDAVVEALLDIRRRVEERPVLAPPPEEFLESHTAAAFAEVLRQALGGRGIARASVPEPPG